MRYLVLLDYNSVIGAAYLEGKHDGIITSRGVTHPVLDCTEVATDAYTYLSVTRDMKRHGGGSQTLFIPHHAVVAVLGYAIGDPAPMGFLDGSSSS